MRAWDSNFRTKLLDFTLVVRLNWLEKIELRGYAGPPWSSVLFIVNYYCTRVLLYAKMLKETENEETRCFLSNFCHWWHFNWEVPSSLGYSPGYANDFEIRSRLKFFHKKKHLKQNQKKLFFQNVQNSSQVTWQFFETSRNCMTLLGRGQVVVIITTYFCMRII